MRRRFIRPNRRVSKRTAPIKRTVPKHIRTYRHAVINNLRFEKITRISIYKLPEPKRSKFLNLLEKVDKGISTYNDAKELYDIICHDLPELKEEFEKFLSENECPTQKQQLTKSDDFFKGFALGIGFMAFLSLIAYVLLNEE